MLIQQITPEILEWISLQARAGYRPEAVVDALLKSGWQDGVAREAVALLKRGRIPDVPAPVRVPDPDPKDECGVLRTSDRKVRVLASMRNPRIVVFEGLLSDAECDFLIEQSRPKLVRSGTLETWGGGDEVTEWRSSDGTYFRLGENDVLKCIEQRIAELVQWPVDHGEGTQVLRYGVGGEYRSHHDYFDPTVPGSARTLNGGGQRVATLLMYLHAPARGGATVFTDVSFQVAPVKGNAVFFSYDRPHPVSRTLHAGAPVIEGEKWIATKWLREGVCP